MMRTSESKGHQCGVSRFIDGRTELYGEEFFVDHNAATGVEPDDLFRLFGCVQMCGDLMRAQSAAIKLLDHVDGWQKANDIATIHLRTAGAVEIARWNLVRD